MTSSNEEFRPTTYNRKWQGVGREILCRTHIRAGKTSRLTSLFLVVLQASVFSDTPQVQFCFLTFSIDREVLSVLLEAVAPLLHTATHPASLAPTHMRLQAVLGAARQRLL
jgi:hypothetical protein